MVRVIELINRILLWK